MHKKKGNQAYLDDLGDANLASAEFKKKSDGWWD